MQENIKDLIKKTLKYGITLRPIEDEDMSLLRSIYGSTREKELGLLTNWTSEQKDAFIDQQFKAQHIHYHLHCMNRSFMIILVDDHPAGRLYLDEKENEMRIVDITLLPAYRGLGFGEFLIKQVFEIARIAGKKVGIHVERNNKARRLYERLGFKITDDSHAIYLLYQWEPSPPGQ